VTRERDLDKLLSSIAPVLLDDEFVFCTFAHSCYGDHQELKPFACCVETEGLTLVVPKSRADDAGLGYDCVCKGISLGVHSSLEAVGLTAAISTKLARRGISANMIAGYFHDHIFVQSKHAENAVAALGELAREKAVTTG